jgi:AraC family ethanolamine operon transcriptional activator
MKLGANAASEPPYFHIQRGNQDVDDQADCLTNWDQRYDQLTKGSFKGEYEEFWFGTVQLFREKLNQTVHQRGTAWPASRTLAVPIVMDGTGWFNGEPVDTSSVLALHGCEEMDWRTPRHSEVLTCTVDSIALNTYAQQVDQRNLELEATSRSVMQVSPPIRHAFSTLLSTMMSSLRAAPMLLDHAHTRRAMEQAMYSAIIDTVHAQGPTGRPSSRTRNYIVSRARDYMLAHIDEPITVPDLCIALGVSRRTLQYCFHDVLDMNPVKFLRALRLNAARRALKRDAASGQSTVTEIALQWGFWHLSYFSAEYKAMFGELPSETLRSAGRIDESYSDRIYSAHEK